MSDPSSQTPKAPQPETGADRNRDAEQRPGSPPTSAYVPKGSENSTHSDKTQTDPDTGAPANSDPEPADSKTDRDV
ncbi:hypothetical protein [Phenylobacterium sp.]|uniref:hypothetical protein n=1 Tax=Phenylobacterium sp. TaxID=1871053 RepID=UPI0027312135|nr:hypothetical protein [Phenylobacterium sp.]MDP1874092.1 hypothetical protein [Phenylobacterium sp.]MDP3300202.1 hypothetical protein [Phenylobacterium sp.]MDP3490629.1 hypothetical protein [Phenylobacterium sp.]